MHIVFAFIGRLPPCIVGSLTSNTYNITELLLNLVSIADYMYTMVYEPILDT